MWCLSNNQEKAMSTKLEQSSALQVNEIVS